MSITGESSTSSRELFLSDLEHFEESIWRNEEVGEKRFNFFLTLVTAVVGGLLALWTSDHVSDEFRAKLPALIWQSNLALLIFGLLTYWRMIHRDRVTAEYKATTHYIRSRYKDTFHNECPELGEYILPLEKKSEERKKVSEWKRRSRRISQAGYTQTVAVVNGILFVALLVWANVLPMRWATVIGVLLAMTLCVVGSASHDRK